MTLFAIRIMVIVGAVLLVMLWLFAAFDKTPEERREDDEDQIEWIAEHWTAHERRQQRGQHRNEEAVLEEIQKDDGAA